MHKLEIDTQNRILKIDGVHIKKCTRLALTLSPFEEDNKATIYLEGFHLSAILNAEVTEKESCPCCEQEQLGIKV